MDNDSAKVAAYKRIGAGAEVQNQSSPVNQEYSYNIKANWVMYEHRDKKSELSTSITPTN